MIPTSGAFLVSAGVNSRRPERHSDRSEVSRHRHGVLGVRLRVADALDQSLHLDRAAPAFAAEGSGLMALADVTPGTRDTASTSWS
jgi:hypothetical protein